MQREVFTISAECKINEALNLMHTHDLHRLPVLRGEKLVGLITVGLIAAHSPSKASSLSVHEMNYLLSKMSVSEIMITEIITITPDALIEKAAFIMRENDIGCLPVVDKKYALVGIITINDVIDAFIDLLGYFTKGIRLEIEVKNDNIGVLADITATFGLANINIARLSVYQENGEFIIIILTTSLETAEVEKLLANKGYTIKDKIIYNN